MGHPVKTSLKEADTDSMVELKLTQEQMELIQKAKSDIRDGLFVTHDDMVKKVLEWRRK